MIYDQNGEPRYYGLHYGFVVDNKDPEKLGRVTVIVPGLIEPASSWAIPIGMAGGSKQDGGWSPPKIGAAVGVFFHQGDIDEPAYMSGWFGRGESPTPVAAASVDDAADKVRCYETERHLVVIDGRSGQEQVLIKDKSTNNAILMKGDTIQLGGEGLMLPKDGVVNGEAIDTFTGMPMWMLGHASTKVFAKKAK